MNYEKREPLGRNRQMHIALPTAVYVFSLCFSFFGAIWVAKNRPSSLWLALLELLAFLLPAALFMRSEAGKRFSWGNNGFSWRTLWRALLFLLGALLLSLAFFSCFGQGLPVYGFLSPFPQKNEAWFVPFLAFVLFPAVCEEILIRGLWQTTLQKSSIIGTVLVSACMSAAFGFSPYAVLWLFLTGLIFSLLRLQSGSAYAPVLCALLWRMGMFFAFPFLRLDDWLEPSMRMLLCAIAALLALIFVFLALDRPKLLSMYRAVRGLEKTKKEKVYLPLFGVALVFIGALFVYICTLLS